MWSDLTRDIVLRTVAMATLVTIGAAVVALPIAYFMAKVASPRAKAVLFVAVLMPLWSSYIVRVLARGVRSSTVTAWSPGSPTRSTWMWVIDRILDAPVIGGADLTTSFAGQYVVFLYIWLPYMILPVQAAFERVPDSLLEASDDLGAKPAEHVPEDHMAARAAGHRGRIDLHVLAHTRRLHHPAARRPVEADDRPRDLPVPRRRRQPPARRRLHRDPHGRSWPST